MRSRSPKFERLRALVEQIPLVDTHDHTWVCGPRYADPIQVIVGGYMRQDIDGCCGEQDKVHWLANPALPLQQRWPVLERAWRQMRHSAFAQETLLLLRKFYNETEVSWAALQRMAERLPNLEATDVFENILEQAGIKVRILNILRDEFRRSIPQVLTGTVKLSPRAHLAVRLPPYHEITCWAEIAQNMAPLNRQVTSLDEYLAGCREIFEAYKRAGAVCFKDQCAYSRPLNFSNPSRGEAEKIFNRMLELPRHRAAYPDGIQPLEDFLFHEFLRTARDMNLPVQLHTGKLGYNWQDCRALNAVGLIPLLNLHREVRFDLLHANWPYAEEMLFLVRQYPNVRLNLCWTQVVDPLYCQELMRRATCTTPHVRVHAFGADYGGYADRAWAAAAITRDNVAAALADLIDQGWLDFDGATEIARAWLFDNPNAFYRLNAQCPAKQKLQP